MLVYVVRWRDVVRQRQALAVRVRASILKRAADERSLHSPPLSFLVEFRVPLEVLPAMLQRSDAARQSRSYHHFTTTYTMMEMMIFHHGIDFFFRFPSSRVH